MKTIIILLGILFLLNENALGQNWNKISKIVKEKQTSIFLSPLNEDLIKQTSKTIKKKRAPISSLGYTYIDTYYDMKKSSKCLEEFSSKSINDTIYVIEFFGDYSSSGLALVAWNKSDTISCNSNDAGRTYNIEKNILFTKYMMKLVSEWNIEEIKEEEKTNGNSIPQYYNFASRIIINNKKYKIDCIYFKDFFNLERDGMDFRD